MSDGTIKGYTGESYDLRMYRKNMDNIPEYPIPEVFALENFYFRNHHPTDGYKVWTDIMQMSPQDFYADFGDEESQRAMPERTFYLMTGIHQPVGTVSAWWTGDSGNIHWLGVHPKYQRCGLSKPLMSVAMRKIAEHHDDCYVLTTSDNLVAVKVYLDFGFVPTPQFEEGARDVAQYLKHPILQRLGYQSANIRIPSGIGWAR